MSRHLLSTVLTVLFLLASVGISSADSGNQSAPCNKLCQAQKLAAEQLAQSQQKTDAQVKGVQKATKVVVKTAKTVVDYTLETLTEDAAIAKAYAANQGWYQQPSGSWRNMYTGEVRKGFVGGVWRTK